MTVNTHSNSLLKGNGTRTILISGSVVIIIKGRYSIEGEPKIIFVCKGIVLLGIRH